MMKRFLQILALLVVALVAAPAYAQSAYDLNWNVTACGGETSVGMDFELSSTIGQPAAGLMAGSGFELSSGFWTIIDPSASCGSADFDCDGDLGTDADIEAFFACLAGNCPSPPCTGSADFNADGDLGTDADIEAFFRVLAGGSC